MTDQDEPSPELLVEEINKIINSRSEFFLKNYPMLRKPYREGYETPELDTWRHEVCLCLFFGLYQASITATNHLLESFLKLSLKHYLSRPWRNPDVEQSPAGMMEALEKAQNTVDDLDLENTINRTCGLGIISKDDKKELKRLKNSFRNPYSHASKHKLLGDDPVTMFPTTWSEEEQFKSFPPISVPVGQNPIVGWYAQLEHAKVTAMPYFLYLDDLIRKTLSRLYAEEPPEGGATTPTGEGGAES